MQSFVAVRVAWWDRFLLVGLGIPGLRFLRRIRTRDSGVERRCVMLVAL
jgi:hypothetical protein